MVEPQKNNRGQGIIKNGKVNNGFSEEQIVSMYDNKFARTKIAKVLGTSFRKVNQILSKYRDIGR